MRFVTLPLLAAAIVAAGCKPKAPPAPGGNPAGSAAAGAALGATSAPAPGFDERNAEFKFVVRWPDKTFIHEATNHPTIPGARLFFANCTPGGALGPVTYTLSVFAPPPPAKPSGPPAATVEEFLAQQTEGVAKTVATSKPATVGPAGRPGLEVLTQAPLGEPGGGTRYERAVYTLHNGRGYVVGAYCNNRRELLTTAEVDRFLASFEITD